VLCGWVCTYTQVRTYVEEEDEEDLDMTGLMGGHEDDMHQVGGSLVQCCTMV
jgi:hypothetical protein